MSKAAFNLQRTLRNYKARTCAGFHPSVENVEEILKQHAMLFDALIDLVDAVGNASEPKHIPCTLAGWHSRYKAACKAIGYVKGE